MKKTLYLLAISLVLSTSRTSGARAVAAKPSWQVSLDKKNPSYLNLTVDATKVDPGFLIKNIVCAVAYLNKKGSTIKQEQIAFVLPASQDFVGGNIKKMHYHYTASGTVSVKGLDMTYDLSAVGHEYYKKMYPPVHARAYHPL